MKRRTIQSPPSSPRAPSSSVRTLEPDRLPQVRGGGPTGEWPWQIGGITASDDWLAPVV